METLASRGVVLLGRGGAIVVGLLRTVGAAVALGAGAKAGGDLYQAFKKRFGAEDEAAAAEPAPVGADDDLDAAEARLKAERARIDRELRRVRRKKAAQEG